MTENLTDMDIEGAKAGFDLVRSAIQTAKDLVSLAPSSESRIDAEKQIQLAEREIALAEAQIAQSLGYELCQCTFPPSIMLFKEIDNRRGGPYKIFECSACNSQEPPREKRLRIEESYLEADRYNEQLRDDPFR